MGSDMGTFDETSLFVLYLGFCVWRNLNAKKKLNQFELTHLMWITVKLKKIK